MGDSTADPCLCYSQDGNHSLDVIFFVDDGLVTEINKEVEIFISKRRDELKINTGLIDTFLGIKIIRDDEVITLSQETYTKKFLNNLKWLNKIP